MTYEEVMHEFNALPPEGQRRVAELITSLRHLNGANAQPASNDAETFHQLAKHWSEETRHTSSWSEMISHPAYLSIIGMGERAIPYLLRELRKRPDHWHWALGAITRQPPIQPDEDFDTAIARWLQWGKERGYIA
jgi:hypothetical protein